MSKTLHRINCLLTHRTRFEGMPIDAGLGLADALLLERSDNATMAGLPHIALLGCIRQERRDAVPTHLCSPCRCAP